ncbi:MAG: diguanylate cyclase [Gaiellaceae bacterium]
MSEQTIQNIMTRDVVSVAPDSPLQEAIRTMRELRISCTVVCVGNVPVGMVTERDMPRIVDDLLAGEDVLALSSGDVMSKPVITVRDDTGLDLALAQMQEAQIRRLVVVDESGYLVGVVTQTDLLGAYVVDVERHRALLEQAVLERTQELEQAKRRLDTLAREDSLLGIGNRRGMAIALERAHAAAERYGRSYAVALFDVDHFKSFNDIHGHQAGDEVLQGVTESLGQTIRHADTLFRYGGEQLLLLLPETTPDWAQKAAERARVAVEAAGLTYDSSPHGCVTVSCGVGGFWPPDDGVTRWEHIVRRAEEALQIAKQSGRNRVSLSDVASRAA